MIRTRNIVPLCSRTAVIGLQCTAPSGRRHTFTLIVTVRTDIKSYTRSPPSPIPIHWHSTKPSVLSCKQTNTPIPSRKPKQRAHCWTSYNCWFPGCETRHDGCAPRSISSDTLLRNYDSWMSYLTKIHQVKGNVLIFAFRSHKEIYNEWKKVKQSRYRSGVAQRFPGS